MNTRTACIAVVLVAVLGLAASEPARAQTIHIDPGTGDLTEASAATTIMLDPLFLALHVPADEIYSIPLDRPGGGEVLSHPERFWSFVTAEAHEGAPAIQCRTAAELESATRSVPGHVQ